MSDPLVPSASRPISDPAALSTLHAGVVGSEVPDETYTSPISNKEKVEYICRNTGLGAINLIDGYPYFEWSKSQDLRLVTAGLFLTDLQLEFYGKWINGAPKRASHKLWEAQATAEFWHGRFKVENVHLRFNAELILDRVIN